MVGKTDTENACMEADFLDNALVMIAVLGEKGRIISWNHAAETITGYPHGEVVGSTVIWEWLYPDKDYRRSIARKIAGILAKKNYFQNLETTIRIRSGESRVILWNTKEIPGDGLHRIIAVGMDVTGQKESNAFRESIIDNAYILMAVLDPKGEILVWNKAAETITGWSPEEVIGRRDIWKHLYPDPGYRKEITSRIAKIISAHNYFENFETTIVTKSGKRRIISWNTRQIRFAGTYREIAIGRDITEQRQAEEALVAYMTEMAMRIKQPIGIIRDNLKDTAGLIREGKLSPEEIAMLLDGQVRNATQVETNVQGFQKAIVEKHGEIPEAYRKFLEG
jgi:PAS domain S-box-containing protein